MDAHVANQEASLAQMLSAKTTPATRDTGYPNTGYPTLATHKADTDYPDSGYASSNWPYSTYLQGYRTSLEA
jgi:hypothetical protein